MMDSILKLLSRERMALYQPERVRNTDAAFFRYLYTSFAFFTFPSSHQQRRNVNI